LLKYRGYLLGKLGRFTEAKTDIDLAIRFFSQQKYEMGVMVSEFDLSRVYESEQKPDSALKYAMLTLSYWQRRKDTSRVLASANQTINLYIKIKRYDAASAMQRQTIPLLEKQDMHPQQIMDFYFLSIQLFKKTNDTVQEKRYQEIFDQKEKQLKTEDRMPVPGFSVYP
jgi:tetratricopeptide (TPR) repeat protein